MISVRRHNVKFFFLILLIFTSAIGFSQDTTVRVERDSSLPFLPADSVIKMAPPISNAGKVDSVLKKYSPKSAAIRSALLPGLGQIYNKKYWKLPIVYGALGISGAVFAYNVRNYRDLRFAYKAKFKAQPSRDPSTGAIIPGDSSDYKKIRSDLINIDINSLRSYRDEFRRNVDYSALAFILLWGLNVVDATVDAHLKSFDVSPDLSLKFKIGPSRMAGTNGVSLILAFK